ncbi:MAG TPA: methionyl-tRNA formyltransferase [Gaiellales bacterium]|nr:methionyl-tRNA formyltransferase [Gaiellales bacterium]
MKVAFFGTSAFGAEVLRSLVERGRLDVTTVVSQPDRPSGRGRAPTPPPVAEAARSLGLRLRQLEDASAAPPDADAGIVVAFGQLVREPLLHAYPLVNLHPSALPRWRGAAPIERAIMAGDSETAVAAIELSAELDAGPILGEERIEIGTADDAGAVRARALELGVPLLERALLDRPTPRPQSEEGVTYAHKITAEDRPLRWSRPAVELDRQVRALSPALGARAQLGDRTCLVWRARPLADGPPEGRIADGLVVGCGQGALQILELQPAGKGRMEAAAYLRGLREPPTRAA